MTDYRRLHNSAGHGEKPSRLTDFEHRVWIQMRASSDDFGVGPLIPGKLQGDNRYLARKATKALHRAMLSVIGVGLFQTFDHQGQTYYFQPDWQDWEAVTYPKRSMYPYPPLDRISERTQRLIEEAEESFSKKSSKVPRMSLGVGDTSLTTNLQPITNNLQPLTGDPEKPSLRILDSPIIRKRKPWCHYEGERIEVPQKWHDDHVRKLGGPDAETRLEAWYRELDLGLVRSQAPIVNWFKWLDACYATWAQEHVSMAEYEAHRPKGA